LTINIYKNKLIFFFQMSHSTDADSHIRTSTQPYEYTHPHPTHMSISERLNRFDLEVHKVGYQECLAVDKYVAYH
jgi:hypothetical protein